MILADTSIWVDHLRHENPMMTSLLQERRIVLHPFVLGELAMGSLPDRTHFLGGLLLMRSLSKAADDEVLRLIENGPHHAKGLSWVDMHLLAAVLLYPGVELFTRDNRLSAAAEQYGRGARLLH